MTIALNMKNLFLSTLRRTKLLMPFDKGLYLLSILLNYRKNRNFLKSNPSIKLPPDYLMYESFRLDYEQYYTRSRESAASLLKDIGAHIPLSDLRILDWGCGPGRIVRHLPNLCDKSCSIYATDYNTASIDWCRKSISGVSFAQNSSKPPCGYQDNFFNIIYGISIFTHLSEEMHYSWYNELLRITSPGGIIYLTTQGEAFKTKLLAHEKQAFCNGKLVVRGKVKEGHRTYSAFQPAAFMNQLTIKETILEHREGKIENGRPQQDIWIIKKSITD